MAVTYGFFNAVKDSSGGYDRTYTADQMSEYFRGIVTDGVLESVSSALQVLVISEFNISVEPGRAFVDSHWYQSTTAQAVAITPAHATLNRITSVVLHLSYSDRSIALETIDGEYAASAVAPTVTNTDTDKYLTLAQISVKAGATELTQADITDTRPDESLCGWVTGYIKQIDTDAFWKQLEAGFDLWQKSEKSDFDTWFQNVKDELSTNQAGNLQNQINDINSALSDIGVYDPDTETLLLKVDATYDKDTESINF